MRDELTKDDTHNAQQVAQLGRHVHHLRQSRGLSVRGLTAQAKVDATWLSRLEHGLHT